MECIKITERLFEYAEGSLPAYEQEQFAAHLKQCSSCQKEYQYIKQIHLLIDKEKNTVVPSALTNSLLHIQDNTRVIPLRNSVLVKQLAAAAVLVVGLALGAVLGNEIYTINKVTTMNEAYAYSAQSDEYLESVFLSTNEKGE